MTRIRLGVKQQPPIVLDLDSDERGRAALLEVDESFIKRGGIWLTGTLKDTETSVCYWVPAAEAVVEVEFDQNPAWNFVGIPEV